MKKIAILFIILLSLNAQAGLDINKSISELKTSGFAGSALLGPKALGLANKIVFKNSFMPSNHRPHTKLGTCEIIGKDDLIKEGDSYGIVEVYEQYNDVVLLVANYYHRRDSLQIICHDLSKKNSLQELQQAFDEEVSFK